MSVGYLPCPVCSNLALTFGGRRTVPCGACISSIERLAASLSHKTADIRLRKIGEEMPNNMVPFSELPVEDQEQWRTLAQAVMELGNDSLRELLDDAVERSRGAL